MAERILITINGQPRSVPTCSTIAAALLAAGITAFRRSITGQPRAPLCGMGICYECAVTIDGVPHCRSCQTLCRAGMTVWTDAR